MRTSAENVRLLDEIIPGVFLGNYEEARNSTLLHRSGVTHILNVAQGLECCFPEDFIYRHVAMQDMEHQDLLDHIKDNNEYRLFSFIESALSHNGKVFVHCAAGISRSSATVVAFLMWKRGLRFREALEYTHSRHPATSPNSGFVRQLLQYECQLVTCTQRPEDCTNRFLCTCGGYLFNLTEVLTHEPLVAKHCRCYFIKQPEWLDYVDAYSPEKVLKCFRCHRAVGELSWSGIKCPCGRVVKPGFLIDEQKYVSHSVQKIE